MINETSVLKERFLKRYELLPLLSFACTDGITVEQAQVWRDEDKAFSQRVDSIIDATLNNKTILRLVRGCRQQLQKLSLIDRGYFYLIKSGPYYKIGITSDWKKRLANYRTANPNFEVLLCEHVLRAVDIEKYLLSYFVEKLHVGEWFTLNDDDTKYICSYLSDYKVKDD